MPDPNNTQVAGLDDFSEVFGGVDNTPKPVDAVEWDDIGITDDPKPAGDPAPADPAPADPDPAPTDPPPTDPSVDEEKEDELFYDAKRDHPQARVAPTLYRDRESATVGVIAKVSLISDLKARLENMGSGMGALDVPEALEGEWDNLEILADPERLATMDDETLKKTVFEFDKVISAAKTKANTIEQKAQQEREIQVVSEALDAARKQATSAMDTLDLKFNKEWTDEQFISEAMAKVDEFKSNQDYIDEHGLNAYWNRMSQLQRAADSIREFIQVAQKEVELQSKSKPNEPTRVDPRDIQRWYDEFKMDQPDLPIFNAPTDEPEMAFLEYFARKGYKVEGPHSYKKGYEEYRKSFASVTAKAKADRAAAEARRLATGNPRQSTPPPVALLTAPAQPAPSQPIADFFDKQMAETIKAAMRNGQ